MEKMLNFEDEEMPSESWWKKYDRDIEKAKKRFIKSGRIGGNPYYLDEEKMKDPENQKFLKRLLKEKKVSKTFYNRCMKGVADD